MILSYSTRTINLNFRIKVNGMYNGKKMNTLVGVSGLLAIVDDAELTDKMIRKAFSSKGDKLVCKLRRGIKITFYAK